MKNSRLKLSALALAIASSLTATAVTAAEADEQVKADDDVEVIQIRGIRASTKKNLNQKRFAMAIVDTITPEDIGKFPDKNVADTLSRIPGVTISRDFGEGEGVTIRGFTPNQNVTLLNGQGVGTAQWFVLNNTGRNFNFEMLASEMVGGLEVYKSPQADIEEGALGGTVIVNTRKPLEMESGTIAGSVDMQYSELPDEWDPSASIVTAWLNEDETFGINVSAAIQNRTVERHSQESDFGWFGPGIARIAVTPPKNDTPQEQGSTPWGVGSAVFKQDRERVNFDMTAQWMLSDQLDVSVHYLFSEMEASNVNSNMIGIPFRGIAVGDDYAREGTTSGGYLTHLEYYGDPAQGGWVPQFLAYDNIYRDGSKMGTQVLDFEVNYEADFGQVHFQAGTTTGKGDIYDFFTEFWADPLDSRAGIIFDNPNPSSHGPAIDFERANPWMSNPTDQMYLGGIFNQYNEVTDSENYAQVDVTMDLELGLINQVKFGGKIKDRSFEQERHQDNLSNLAGWGAGSLGPVSDFWSGDLLNIEHAGNSLQSQTYFDPDRSKMFDALYAQPACTSALVDAGTTCLNRDQFQPLASFNIEETITSLYAMANFEGDNFRGNFGVRYVSTDATSNGYDASATAVAIDNSYSNLLPSVNVTYTLSDDLLLRAAASKTISRPSPFSMAPAFNLTPETGRGDAGNPDLKPTKATSYDLGMEYYFTESSLLAATYFYKDITDFQFNNVIQKEINGVQYNQLNSPDNGDSSSYSGFELQVQHIFDNGFGGFANYTFVDASEGKYTSAEVDGDGNVTMVDGSVQFPDVSENAYNLGVFYETDTYSARLNYNYRSEYFTTQTEFGPTFRDATSQMDAQISYDVSENITVKFEVVNLTDESFNNYLINDGDVAGYQYTGTKVVSTESQNGRRFYVGANFKF
ncbi:TonB-dependent receptor [Psychrosphaera sp. B3R10]|uniref:TonB-dependent receptor n=1 Tax=unclassified Psychrosphaera TaxID=2641570 RepID=UPI001C09E544|nr:MULTISPECIES: TonB-dependent receptor [unclassified Psychrosphaera]MBU2882664.1 TonB-dependent receptor [Psychrosphaera sp. I2R16]MBU2989317.1 TonB-dependent receptor [Psychrosphaera sp. B3R10]MDO6718151.1 TonB-dependent receptor [Psychrosphaera sp. 1_MG-2023]